MYGMILAVQQSPVTGDSFSPVMIAIIAGAAIVGLIVSSVLAKKKK